MLFDSRLGRMAGRVDLPTVPPIDAMFFPDGGQADRRRNVDGESIDQCGIAGRSRAFGQPAIPKNRDGA